MTRGNVLRILAALAAQFATAAAPASAQLSAAIEGVGSHITYAGADALSAVLIRPVLEWSSPSLSVAGSAGFAQFAGGGWTLQGSAVGSSFTPFGSRLGGELAGLSIGSTHQDGTTAGELLARGRVHWQGTRGGAWIGGALGQAWNGIIWQGDRKADVGVWLRRSQVTLTASATPTWIGADLKFVDAELTADLLRDPFELSASGGIRQWSRPAGAAGGAWGGASAVLWLDPHLALVAAGGSYPTDYGQGLLAGSYLSLGVRLASSRSGRSPPAPMDTRLSAAANGRLLVHSRPSAVDVSTFDVLASGGGEQTFVIGARGARRVDLMGDFTGWQTVPLSRAGNGLWRVTLALSPGSHRMNVRVDDGDWGVPPNLPSVADDFGGRVAILQIPVP